MDENGTKLGDFFFIISIAFESLCVLKRNIYDKLMLKVTLLWGKIIFFFFGMH